MENVDYIDLDGNKIAYQIIGDGTPLIWTPGGFAGTEIALPVAFEIVSKTEKYIDKKTGKEKRKSKTTKNEHARQMLQAVCINKILFKYVLTDIWFASAENMRFVKLDLKKDFIMAQIKVRRG